MNDKDAQIKFLIDEVNKQKDLNTNLNKQLINYEETLNKNKEQYLSQMNNLNNELQKLMNEKKL